MLSDAERVKQLTDVSSVIGRYIELSPSGASLKGICPFHSEKTPSFHVFPRTGTWHCFGCGAGGDVIAFVMRYASLSFIEALEELADQCGITLEGRRGFSRPETGLFDLLREAQKWFVERLASPEGAAARDYLKARDFIGAAGNLGFGYSPGGLPARLRSLGFSDTLIQQSGVATAAHGSLRDRFRKRLTFPIRDRRGRVVSFGGRALDGGGPKYLNGPDSEVYHKGSLLYGFSDGAPAAREAGMAILVEGYFDHARVYSSGFAGVVATCGTALTEVQARIFRTMADDTVICFDGDGAGVRSAVRAAMLVLAAGGLPRMMKLPEDMDPDDFIAGRGMAAFMELAERAPGPVGFCAGLLGGGFPRGVAGVRAAKRLMEIVSSASDPLVREQLLLEVESFTGYSRSSLEGHLKYAEKEHRPLPVAAEGQLHRADREIMAAVVSGGSIDSGLLRWLEPGDFRSDQGRSLFLALRRQMEDGCSTVNFGLLSPEHGSICSKLASAMAGMRAGDRDKIMARVERERLSSLRVLLKERLAVAEPDEKTEILRELQTLDRRRHDGGKRHSP